MYKKIVLSLLAVAGLAQAIPETKSKLRCGGVQLFSKENKCTIIAQVTNLEEFEKLPVIRLNKKIKQVVSGKWYVFAEVTQDQLMHILEQPFVISVQALK